MEIILASNNAHKLEELSSILYPHKILLPSGIGINFTAEENGKTYFENALIKAQTLFDQAGGRTVLADDSGLSVPALNGEPGIYSARYGSRNGVELKAEERNRYLLENMKSFKDDDRKAFFVCCMVLITGSFRIFSAQETFNGLIAEKPYGKGGFGYDPVFFVPEKNKTAAELPPGEKNAVSHRGRAGLRIKSIMDNIEKYP